MVESLHKVVLALFVLYILWIGMWNRMQQWSLWSKFVCSDEHLCSLVNHERIELLWSKGTGQFERIVDTDSRW